MKSYQTYPIKNTTLLYCVYFYFEPYHVHESNFWSKAYITYVQNKVFYKKIAFLVQITTIHVNIIVYVPKDKILKLQKYDNSAYNFDKSSYNIII
jgi:hypothetical protein